MKTIKPPSFYSGFRGLQLPVPQYLYPHPFKDASRLTFYASLFNSIELIVESIPKSRKIQNSNG